MQGGKVKTLRIITTLATLCLVTCVSVPYKVSLAYGGAYASYDGKRVVAALDVRGFSK